MTEYKVTDVNGREVKRGDIIKNFRGEASRFGYVSRGPAVGKSAKVVVNITERDNGRELYANVFDLTVEVL